MRSWGSRPRFIQLFGDLPETGTGGAAVEHTSDDYGLRVVDSTLNVLSAALGVDYLDVVVAKHPTAGDVPGLRLPEHGS